MSNLIDFPSRLSNLSWSELKKQMFALLDDEDQNQEEILLYLTELKRRRENGEFNDK